jgi:three-Cys-motif partner protein
MLLTTARGQQKWHPVLRPAAAPTNSVRPAKVASGFAFGRAPTNICANTLERLPLGHAINLLLHRAGIGIDVEGDGFCHISSQHYYRLTNRPFMICSRGEEREEAVSDDDFYDIQSEASNIKTRIVTKYFLFWAKVMVPQARSWAKALAYIDLYAGPGRYDDGTKSTPILVLEAAIQNPELSRLLVTTFNDRSPELAARLRSNIQQIPGIETLTYQPQVHSVEVDEEVADMFGRAAMIPSFSFVDPFGYKGITQRLLKGMLKDWGCDLILFFSYARINAAIDNEIFEEHISALFGEDRLRNLRGRLGGKRPWEREALILEAFSQVLKDLGFKYVLPFTFRRKEQDRTSHHLILVTKHPLGYTVMKEIMTCSP